MFKFKIYTNHFLCLLIYLLSVQFAIGQKISINNSGSTADNSAILDLAATDKGMLIPRMTSSQRTAINNPSTGLMVFDLSENQFMFYDGTIWKGLGGADNLGDHIVSQNLQLENFELSHHNTVNSVVVDSSGRVGMGTTSPQAPFQAVLGYSGETVLSPHPSTSNLVFSPTWQSFTATEDMVLHSIFVEIVFFGGPMTLDAYTLYEGEGTNGPLLYSGGLSSNGILDFPNYIFLKKDHKYTFHITPTVNTALIQTAGYLYPEGISSVAGHDLKFGINKGVANSWLYIDSIYSIFNGYILPESYGSLNSQIERIGTIGTYGQFRGRTDWIPFTDIDNQDISYNTNQQLSISNVSDSIDLSMYLDNVDQQSLSLSNDTLYLSGDESGVDLSPFLFNTDEQSLSLNGSNLSLTNDPSPVDLSVLSFPDQQDLTRSGDDLYLSNDPTPVNLTAFRNADNLGTHSASQNLQLNDHWLGQDGDDDVGLVVDDAGQVGIGLSPLANFNVVTTKGVLADAENSLYAFSGISGNFWQSFTTNT